MYFTAETIVSCMKMGARYLVRLENARGLPVEDYLQTRGMFRERLRRVECNVNSARISSIAVEIDFHSADRRSAAEGIKLLEGEGKVLSITDLMAEDTPGSVEEVMEEAKRLFNDERFWEVHEKVEGIWRRATGDEKNVQQSIILYASALVHYQKNEPEVTLRMLRRSLDKMRSGSGSYHSFDLDRLRKEAEMMFARRKVHIFKL